MKRNPIGSKVLWLLTAVAGAAVGAVAIVAATSKSQGGQASVWTPLAPDPNTQQILLPANATFAVSVPASDANANGIGTNFTQAQSVGAVVALQGFSPGQAPPASYPNDNLGTAAYRLVGTVGTLPTTITVDQTTQAWVWSGVRS